MKKLLLILSIISAFLAKPAFAFNLITDIEQNTQWGDGTVAAGTAYNFGAKTWVGTALVELSSYRMLSLWYGVDNVPQNDTPAVKIGDVGKIGLNLAYVLKNFVNKPPTWLSSIVVGPAIQCSIFTSPHVVQPMADINMVFTFGGSTPTPVPPTPPTTPPALTTTQP